MLKGHPETQGLQEILKLATDRLKRLKGLTVAERQAIQLDRADVRNARFVFRRQSGSGKVAQTADYCHLLYGDRVSMARLIAEAMNEAGGEDCHPDEILALATDRLKRLKGLSVAEREAIQLDRADVRNALFVFRRQSGSGKVAQTARWVYCLPGDWGW